ncbi:heterokaryon incompatibility protein-domain-containing protein [Colletotrichum godetiae]|uniref:Heterokaryon incompatibility protein-domain-containing protein n=1 Tax=Colletotrichum godetiae TaxID=1209918 RepID=A0AAJ0EZN6_9PEZI|nr:heterokaryon incompatibility protein-domain-containing protein [Colletotrichum godetiae]KAK1687703.1 heterokaryon incompatibility protein-domain-containing protein [Colletotrichum godetiae]
MADLGQLSLPEIQDDSHQLGNNEPNVRPLLQDPAKQIRLFTLWPGSQGSAIQGAFSVATLDDEPAYQCISYVWGDASNTKYIMVDGKELKITTSLFLALRRVRSEQERTTLWADALCINQDDHEEKRVQVDMMFEIYSKCSNCLMWLGEVDLLEGKLSLDVARYGLEFIEFLYYAKAEDASFSTAEGSEKLNLTIRSLVKCQWWRRIWIVQECVAPPTATFLWGPFTISRSPLTNFALNHADVILSSLKGWTLAGDEWLIYEAITTLTRLTISLVSLRAALGSGPQGVGEDITSFLWNTCDRQALDPRDKIFALLPFIAGALPSVKSSNYDIDCDELYSRVTVDLIQSSQSLLPLLGRRPSATPVEEPTWVVDWRRKGKTEPIDPQPYVTAHVLREYYNASYGIPQLDSRNVVSSDGRRLSLHGYLVGTIVGTGVPLADASSDTVYSSSFSIRNLVEKWKRDSAADAASTFRELDKTLGTDDHSARFFTMRSDVEKAVLGWANIQGSDDRENLCMAAWLTASKMTTFLTRGGGTGVGTYGTKLGDEVWILCSGHMPFILRPVRNNEDQHYNNSDVDGSAAFIFRRKHIRYHVVSECYMHGAMRGEMSEAGKTVLQTITLY